MSQRSSLASPRWARLTVEAAAVALPTWSLWAVARGMLFSPIGYDEQFFMWGGWSILKGLAPYRDFIEFKPPMTFLSHALALALFGYEGQHFRYFFLSLSLLAFAALLFSLLRRGADAVITAALGLAFVHLFAGPYHEAFFSDTESIGTSYFCIGLALLIAPTTRFRRSAEVLGGAFMAMTALSKEPFAPCVVATWAGCYFLVYRRFSGPSAARYLKYTTAGVVIVVAALSIYMVPTGAMSAYLATVKSYATMFRDPSKGYCVVLGRFHPRGFFADLPAQWSYLHGQFVNLPTLGFLTPFFLASLVFILPRSKALFACALVAMLISVYAVTVSNCYALHYYVLAQSGIFFFLAAGVDALARRPAHGFASRLWMRGIFLAAVAGRVVLAVPPARADAPLPEPEPGLFDFVREHTSPDDKIFTTGPPSLYVYTDRIAAVRESSIIDELLPSMPGDTDVQKLKPLYDELVKNRPKLVFLDPELGYRKHRHLAAAIMPFLSEFKYEKVSDTIYLRP